MKIDAPSLVALREYLDEMMYSLVDLRLSFEVPTTPTGFPHFESLQQTVKRLDPSHHTLFRLFRIGEVVDDASLRAAFPERIFNALIVTELLEQDSSGAWRTPSLLIVPAEGLYLIVGVPPSYPTGTRPCNTWFDMSSYFIANALPRSLRGQRVLDICSGSGLQSLLCAARGADSVLGLELNREAVETARANAILNGLDDRVEFRQSDMLAAVGASESFDFVVCNTPYAPVIEGSEAPRSFEEIGNSVLRRVPSRLPAHLSGRSRGIIGTWRSVGHGSTTYQMQSIASQLEKEGFAIFAYVDRAPDTVDGVLRILQNDLAQRAGLDPARVEQIVNGVRELLQKPERPVDGFYNQLIYFQKGRIESAGSERAVFGLSPPPPTAQN